MTLIELMRSDEFDYRLSSIGKLAAWETEYEHWISSVVRTGHQFWARRQASTTVAFSGHVSASLALNAHLAIPVGTEPPPL